jgi:iron-sulfur cluster repair protein YtfE (RIC family)
MGKTDTIKDRRVEVYLDSLERKQRWKEHAEEADDSLSTFVQRAVEYAIKQGGPDAKTLAEDTQLIQELEEEVADLQQQLKEKDMVIEKLETEAQRRRVEPFLEEVHEGVREYDQELVSVLKDAERVTADELVRRLGIDRTNTEVMQGLTQQLEHLERYGLVKNTANGWRWEG